jgi:predicted porin
MVDADTCPTNSSGERVLALECDPLPPDISQGFVDTFRQFNGSLVDVNGELTTPSDSRLTYFAAIGLTKEWEKWKANLTYTRSFSDSRAAAAVADIVLGRLIWNPAKRWRAELAGSFERQQQATDSSVLTTIVANATVNPASPFLPPVAAQTQAVRVESLSNDAAIDFVRLFFRVSYQLNVRSSVYALVNWRQESLDVDAGNRPDSERFVVGVGVNYHFDPIPF